MTRQAWSSQEYYEQKRYGQRERAELMRHMRFNWNSSRPSEPENHWLHSVSPSGTFIVEMIEEEMPKKKSNDKLDEWLGHSPTIVYSEKDFFSASEELSMLKDDFAYAKQHHNILNGANRASYFGGGGAFSQEYYDVVSMKVVSKPGTSGPITWACHDRLKDLTEAGTVVTLWERGTPGKEDTGKLTRDFVHDMHFEKSLPFSDFLTDCVLLMDKEDGRIRATAFNNWNKRPQKLGAMFYIACRQAWKDYNWAVYYYLGKKAGMSPAESYAFAAATYGVQTGTYVNTFHSEANIATAFKTALAERKIVVANSGTQLLPDTGDGPVGYRADYPGSSFLQFRRFAKKEIDRDYVNRESWNSPQPSNNVFFCENKVTCRQGQVIKWLQIYKNLLISAIEEDAKACSSYLAQLREIHSQKGGLLV